jgi:hypothetical protein
MRTDRHECRIQPLRFSDKYLIGPAFDESKGCVRDEGLRPGEC